jgi:hypothetical protein
MNSAKQEVILANACFVQNVGRIEGRHSAFLKHVLAIERFLSTDSVPRVDSEEVWWYPCLQFVSNRLDWLVWLLIAASIIAIGYALTMPSVTSTRIGWFLRVNLPGPPSWDSPGMNPGSWTLQWLLYLAVVLPWAAARHILYYPLQMVRVLMSMYAAVVELFLGPSLRAILCVSLCLWLLQTI